MSFKSETGFELKFIDQVGFEISCEDKGQFSHILHLLQRADFVSEIFPVVDLDDNYPDKITGKTSDQEGLISALKEWHETLVGQEVSEYKDL